MNETYSLASQRGLSKSPTGRLPFAFPVGSLGRVYFALFAHNITGLGANGATQSVPKTPGGFVLLNEPDKTRGAHHHL